ncbi:MAG: response regulator [Deltaproteobacteria bacterium]|nr:response regulator [Deltaproteobacteria bacterium]
MSGLRALVCDDDTPFRTIVRELLEQRGVEVIEAADGHEALAVFMKQAIDLVVTDFLMPKLDGMQVIRDIRMTGERGRIPIVLMSAISRGNIVGKEELGPDYYMSKPFKPKKMARLLDRILDNIAQASSKSG